MLVNRASTGADLRKVIARRCVLYQDVNKRRTQQLLHLLLQVGLVKNSVNSSHRNNVPRKDLIQT